MNSKGYEYQVKGVRRVRHEMSHSHTFVKVGVWDLGEIMGN